MGKVSLAYVAAIAMLPLAAVAQPARNANIYDGKDHQPTRGESSVSGKSAQELQNLNALLQQRAQQGAKAPGVGSNAYGVQPGGVVPITPTDGHIGPDTTK